MTNYLVVVLICFAFQTSFAKPADSDLVVPYGKAQDDLVLPSPETQVEQDQIHARQLKAEEVNEDAAQSRVAPPREKYHTYVEPNFGSDDEATESAASVSTKLSGPKPKKIYPTYHYGGLHVGPYNPTQLQGDTGGITFADVYGSSPVALIQGDYEWEFWRSFGQMGLKGGLGFFTAQGDGRFVHRPDIQSDEALTLVVIPLTAALTYHLHYWERQFIVPYAEGGADYFGIFEIRSDAQSATQGKYGGGAAAHYAAGLQFQLDFFDKAGLWNLHQEYGINHMYFTAGIRQFFGLSNTFDFSAFMFEGGFTFEF